MARRIGWVVVLFAVATLATARLGDFLAPSLLAPGAALVAALVGALLIGLGRGSEGEAVPELLEPERTGP